ncbi:MAG: hypothetical protein ACFFB3_01360 [Candidatus Hodarchaeota archaeon]
MLASKEDLAQALASASIEIIPEGFILISISKAKLGMLLELVRVLEQGMFAFILGKDQLNLVVNDRTWRKLEFDFDEGRTITGLRLITIQSNVRMDSIGLTKLLAEVLGDRIGNIILAFEDQYLLVHENDVKDVVLALKGLG